MLKFAKKAQSSFEFIAIIGILFVIVLGSLALIQAKANDIVKDRNDVLVDSLSNVISTEIRLAQSAEGEEYYRSFEMPYAVEGNNYTITRRGVSDFEIMLESSHNIVFINENTTGEFRKGTNTIRKSGKNISINS